MKSIIRFIDRIEHSNIFWTLLGISVLFFLLRLPSLIEPHWYGDEGIYQVIGMKLHQGSLLYVDIWDNKPPLLYLIYALFHGEQQSVRFFSLFIGVLTTISFFFLSRNIFRSFLPSVLSTGIFTLLFATPTLEGNIANAENVMLLPTVLAALLIYQASATTIKHISTYRLFFAGLLLGISFLLKAVAIFDLIAFLLFFIVYMVTKKYTLKKLLLPLLLVVGGFFIPFAITVIFFAAHHALPAFFTSVFKDTATYVTGQANDFLFPNGLLIMKIILLIVAVCMLLWKRNYFQKATLFVLCWTIFALFSTFFSQLPYTHYLLLLLPSFCLLVGLIPTLHTKRHMIILCFGMILFVVFVTRYIPLYQPIKTFHYYDNAIQFVTAGKSVKEYQRFFDSRTQRDYEIASFIKYHIPAGKSLFIWGDSPQVYVLAERLPEQKYIAAYHVLGKEDRVNEIQKQLKEQEPDYIVVLEEAPVLPFQLSFYKVKYLLQGATVYEKTF